MMGTACLLLASALTVGPGPPKEPEPLPPLNAGVAEFARSNLGKSVGDGVCTTLASRALEAAGARRASFREPKGDYTWGEPVADFKDVLPGDILQFRDAVLEGRRSVGRGRWVTWHQEYPHHSAIVSRVDQGGKLLTILHQNVAIQGQDESEKGRVREAELRMGSLRKGGWIKAYRPVLPPPSGGRKGFAVENPPEP